MQIKEILSAVAALGGLGLLFGLLLAYAAQKFHVETDSRVDEIHAKLPGANCGGCGFAGCRGFAEALVAGKSEATACSSLSDETRAEIGAILGVEVGKAIRRRAFVQCRGKDEFTRKRYLYDGMEDCIAAARLGGEKACQYACLGYGTCLKACRFGAIQLNDGVAEILPELCTGCGSCVEICPKNVITMVPGDNEYIVACRSLDKGKDVKMKCDVGCIGCGLCVKACKFDAIHMNGNLAEIDYDKCVACGQCAKRCPQHIIHGDTSYQNAAIDETCVGCGLCEKACKFEAIYGEKKEQHYVDTDKCVGCGQCVKVCPKKSIYMVSGNLDN